VLGGLLALVHIALPVFAGGLVFLLCAGAAVFLFSSVGRHGNAVRASHDPVG
jgi:hypothetical protein